MKRTPVSNVTSHESVETPPQVETPVRVSKGKIFLIGVAAAALWSLLSLVGNVSGVWPWSYEVLLGSLITGGTGLPAVIIGTLWHWLNGGIFAIAYGYIFRSFQRSGARFGAYIALVHFAVAGFALALVRAIHPVEGLFIGFRERINLWAGATPGPFYGSLALHLLFGIFVGAVHYRSTRQFRPMSAGTGAPPSHPPDERGFDRHAGPNHGGRPAESGRKESA